MLIKFTVDNYRSIGGTDSFSMVPNSKYKDFCVGENSRYKLLPSMAFYGANASGKSNSLMALCFMKALVLNKCNVKNSMDHLWFDPFLLSSETENASSSFEIIFVKENVKYRYGFDADDAMVYSEWLFADERGQEAKLFYRDIEKNIFYVNREKFKEGRNLKCPSNWLFLWKCDQENGEIAHKIMEWFDNLNLISGLSPSSYFGYTKTKLKEAESLNAVEKLVRKADFSIEHIKLESVEQVELNVNVGDPSKKNESFRIKTTHNKYDHDGNAIDQVFFDLLSQESVGTRKFLSMSAPILDTLQNGKILLIDEIDASLHPLLSLEIVKLFRNKDINTKNAQLLFTAHDTNLLRSDVLDYSQVCFTEKDPKGSTHIHSLSDYVGVNKRKKLDEQYLMGVFGAIPKVSDLCDGQGAAE